MRAVRRRAASDLALAGTLTALGQLEVWLPSLVPGVGDVTGDRPVLALTGLMATLPLAVRRRFPLGALLVVLGAMALQQVLTTPTGGLVLLLAAMTASYSASAHSTTARAALAGAAILAGAALVGEDAGDWAFVSVVLGVAGCSGSWSPSARRSSSWPARTTGTWPTGWRRPRTSSRRRSNASPGGPLRRSWRC